MALPTYTPEQGIYQLTQGFWGHRAAWPMGNNHTVSYSLSSTISAEEKGLIETAFAEWSAITGITFVQAMGTGQIRFSNTGSGAYTSITWSGGSLTSANVSISAAWTEKYGTSVGTYGYQTYLHEIGHALGLGHTGDYDGSAYFANDALYANDSWQTSVMSYFSQSANPNTGASYAYVLTPMSFDVAAARNLYGNHASHEGNTTYGQGSTAGGALDYLAQDTINRSVTFTLVDSSGIDTINFANRADAVRIDLTPGAVSDVFGRTGNMIISDDTVIEHLRTGAGNDTIIGNTAANAIDAGAGNDRVRGGAGNDTLTGGAGDDTLTGGSGADTFVLGSGFGSDQISDFSSDDFIDLSQIAALTSWTALTELMTQSSAGVTLATAQGTLLLLGATLSSLDAAHFLLVNGPGSAKDAPAVVTSPAPGTGGGTGTGGGNGNQKLTGSAGHDSLQGGAGNDTITAGEGNDSVTGGTGADRIWLDAGNDRFFDTAGNEVDVVHGGAGDDVLESLGGRDRLYGDAGNDSLTASDDGSKLVGGLGDDTMTGGAGVDMVTDTGGHDLVSLGAGNDRYKGSGDAAGAGDTVHGGEGQDTILTGAGDDLVYGDAGNDKIVTGAGNDTVSGGAGDDSITLGDGDDSFTDSADAGNDRVRGGAGNEVLTSLGGHDTLDGGAGNDRLTASNDGANLYAGAGDDTITGGTGNDYTTDGGGSDVVSLGAGNDRYIVKGDSASDSDTVHGGAGNDRVLAGNGNDLIWGDSGNDFIAGRAGDDTISGGLGDDTLWGGLGADSFVFYPGEGDDLIRDFAPGTDVIDLTALSGLSDWADLSAHLSQQGANAVLDFGDLTITLFQVSSGALDSHDFLF
ncbi:M10 family metallopeptidase C-terminal domain-containing protein [Rhodobacter lacus]|uniref:M10 family metallopeptidase C-terminal domain-containing protein n=1 Tax=Rhodobacter lacus TaxID=1641972 RepID=A0ABW5ACK8_9RHOB